MATITVVGTPSLCTPYPPSNAQIAGLKAGEALTAGMPCYIKSDGKAWKSNGTAATAPAKVDGWAAESCAVGEAVTLFSDVEFRYGSGLTPGARYYVSATAGAIDDAATTGGTAPVAFAIDATRIFVMKSRY